MNLAFKLTERQELMHQTSVQCLDFFLPHRCALCRSFSTDRGLCADCWKGLVIISMPVCELCSRPLPHAMPTALCAGCYAVPPPLAQTRAALVYNDTSRQLLLKFKHGDGLHLTPLLVAFMRQHFLHFAQQNPIIVPIPLHRTRYFSRRYNQAAELARGLFAAHLDTRMTGAAFAPEILIRRRANASQAGLNRQQRVRNLAGAFAVPHRETARIQKQPILLVDDVMTTGATLFEAARTMTRAGSGPVYAMVAAKVVRA